MINALLRNADRVKLACLAQLVNVIAPIMTNANGLFRHTIYYPYSWGLQMARGEVLNVLRESYEYEVPGIGKVPYLDVTATFSKDLGTVSLFILNRDLSNAHAIDVIWEDTPPGKVLKSTALTGNDLKAGNSFDSPTKVAPQEMSKPATSGGHTKFEVPPRSYNVIQWSS
jgi:alpha-N-arabinofuranosidase